MGAGVGADGKERLKRGWKVVGGAFEGRFWGSDGRRWALIGDDESSLPFLLSWLLYIVLFLHQTAMPGSYDIEQAKLYIVLFLHQTATGAQSNLNKQRLYIVLFLHQTATTCVALLTFLKLYIVLFLHQTATLWK